VQITHFCNSCISIEAGETRLLCDPWIGPADENAWLSFPFQNEGPDIIERLAPNFIYISHLHPDHHDVHTLEHVPKDTTILIKNFRDHRLFGKLQAQGFSNVIELDSWASLTLGDDLEVVIVPSSSMVKEEIDAVIQYDIDTSILVRDLKSGQVFFNNVDNPTSLTALKEVRTFSEKTWGKAPDVACLPVGAASEYPHCFVNIDRGAAARRVINAALNELPERISALGCLDFFMAGGTYVIRGKHGALSRFVAQPTFEEVRAYLSPWLSAGNRLWALEGGHGILWQDKATSWHIIKTGFEKECDKQAYTIGASHMPYDYADVRGQTDEYLERAKTAFPSAKANYDTIMGRIGLAQDWTTKINLYEHLTLTREGDIADGQKVLKQITLPPSGEISGQTLTLHMDLGLFVDLLEGRRNWNGAISGTYILYERTPDAFLPDVPFSLNFLVDRR